MFCGAEGLGVARGEEILPVRGSKVGVVPHYDTPRSAARTPTRSKCFVVGAEACPELARAGDRLDEERSDPRMIARYSFLKT